MTHIVVCESPQRKHPWKRELFLSGFARLNRKFVFIFVVNFPGWRDEAQSERAATEPSGGEMLGGNPEG